MDGTWKTGFYYGSLKDGFTSSRRSARVSRGDEGAIAKQQALIENGKFYEFAGPLYDQSGKLRVKKGQQLTVNAAVRDQLARQGRRSEAPKG